MISDTGAKTIQWGKDSLGVRKTGGHMQKNEVGSLYYIIYKNYLIMVQRPKYNGSKT